MKTFRFFATLLVIALCAGFTSCSNDDDENESNSPLVGTWKMTKSISNGHTYIPGQNGFDSGLGLVFSANGTFYNLVENEKVEEGKYSYDENHFRTKHSHRDYDLHTVDEYTNEVMKH